MAIDLVKIVAVKLRAELSFKIVFDFLTIDKTTGRMSGSVAEVGATLAILTYHSVNSLIII